MLLQLNVPIDNDHVVSCLMRDLLKLQKKVKSIDLFQFNAYNGPSILL